jgi:hypothetical protein
MKKYNVGLAERLRLQFADLANVTEKEMMGGLPFMNKGLVISYIRNNLNEAFRKSETEGCKQIQPEWWYNVGAGN